MAKKRKSSGKKVDDISAHRIWLAGLGALSEAGETGSKAFQRFVERGTVLEDWGRGKVGRAVERAEKGWTKVGSGVESRVQRTLDSIGVPTAERVTVLEKQLKRLSRRLSVLEATLSDDAPKQDPTKGRAAKKSARKKRGATRTPPAAE